MERCLACEAEGVATHGARLACEAEDHQGTRCLTTPSPAELYVGLPLLTRKTQTRQTGRGGDPIGLASEAALHGSAPQRRSNSALRIG
jgi:hypothetical protein